MKVISGSDLGWVSVGIQRARSMSNWFSKAYISAKHLRGVWRAVTKVEKKFYQRGYDAVVRANDLYFLEKYAEAEEMLARPMPDYVRPATHLVRANLSLGDRREWLQHLNNYLKEFGTEPVCLEADGSHFDALTTRPLESVQNGPLVTVIMSVHNAAQTVGMAIRSLLNQTWKPLELVVVDDASTDDSWRQILAVTAGKENVKLLRNSKNVGPYVCRNLALYSGAVEGRLITTHDADDWAHPQRIERHISSAVAASCLDIGSLIYCLRMRANGEFGGIAEARPRSPDGAAQVANVSCIFDRRFLYDRLGVVIVS
jgi:hypothetical protein